MIFVLNVVVYWWSVEFLTKLLLFIDGVFHKYYLFLIVLQTNQNRDKFHKKIQYHIIKENNAQLDDLIRHTNIII